LPFFQKSQWEGGGLSGVFERKRQDIRNSLAGVRTESELNSGL
jgi:hypothetical protein